MEEEGVKNVIKRNKVNKGRETWRKKKKKQEEEEDHKEDEYSNKNNSNKNM